MSGWRFEEVGVLFGPPDGTFATFDRQFWRQGRLCGLHFCAGVRRLVCFSPGLVTNSLVIIVFPTPVDLQ